jgi:hypothetical protein
MKNKNLIYIAIVAGAGYYFYTQNKKKKGTIELGPLEKSSAEEFAQAEVVPEAKPKTLLQKAASLVKKAAATKEGKSLLAKGKKLVSKKLKLEKLGATYL